MHRRGCCKYLVHVDTDTPHPLFFTTFLLTYKSTMHSKTYSFHIYQLIFISIIVSSLENLTKLSSIKASVKPCSQLIHKATSVSIFSMSMYCLIRYA